MYSVRETTKRHGNTNVHILLINLIVTSYLIFNFGINYLVIFCSASLLHILIETGLVLSGIRKSEVYLYGRKLPRFVEISLRSLVEGPAFCVPAYFIADQIYSGNYSIAIPGAFVLVGGASLYMAMADRNHIRKLSAGDSKLVSRRAMTKPGAVMLLALINSICLIAIFLIPDPFRKHAIIYILAYSLLVMLFYFINYQFGVRYIERYDSERKEFYKPVRFYQAAGLTYDSAYEMSLLVSPAYWITFYLGFFH